MRGWTRLLLDETYIAVYCTSCTAYRTAKNGFLCSSHSLFMYLLFWFFHSCFILSVSIAVFLQSFFFAFLHYNPSLFLRFCMHISFFLCHFYFFHPCICLPFPFSFYSCHSLLSRLSYLRPHSYFPFCAVSLLPICFLSHFLFLPVRSFYERGWGGVLRPRRAIVPKGWQNKNI